ncbi:MAG TPA: adenylyl-sulfate kinase [Verrucomicrobiae bacterium]|nr:adenylyl-sulfate kinase [Verrucomicrobiae bacterium]
MSARKAANLFPSAGKITLQEREHRHGHRGGVVWLTGLSASGKSTIAAELERELFQRGCQTIILDGDAVRQGLCSDLTFTERDRHENIRRVGEVAKLFSNAGFICISAFISPHRADRAMVRAMMTDGIFLEVFVNAPLAVCEARDPKGLYAKARAHKIKNFTGVSAPYEPPLNPEIEIHTDKLTVVEGVKKILMHLEKTCGIGKTKADIAAEMASANSL